MFPGDYYIAYIDESGNFGYDFSNPGTSEYFVVTAVIIHPEDVHGISERIQEIRDKEFKGAELKSTSVGGDHARRFRILRHLLDLPFNVMSVVIKKKETYPDSGLGFKPSFIKYSNNLLHKELRTAYSYLEVVSDEHGTEEFMKSFIKYVERQEGSLFSTFKFRFYDSEKCNLLQLADFICGTIAHGYKNGFSREYRAFLSYLNGKILRTVVFPQRFEDYLVDLETSVPRKFDKEIARWCVRAAYRYVDKYSQSTIPQEFDRACVVERLLFQLQTDQPDRYLYTDVLRERIRCLSGREYSTYQFRTSIIAPLRDAGVIIASSAKGYKIPLSLSDIYSYANQTVQMVQPMLERLRSCRLDILVATNNQLDILDVPEYQQFRQYFDFILKDKQI